MTTVAHAFANQDTYCRANGAPLTASVVRTAFAALERGTALGDAVLGWKGDPLADVVPLRLAAGMRALHLGGETRLDDLYANRLTRAESAVVVADVIANRGDEIVPWLAHPPQTNEAGRSAGFMAALLYLSGQGLPGKFELIEIGSSAGINLMMDRFRFTLDGVTCGPVESPVHLSPRWDGAPPPDAPVAIASLRGCDVAPLDLRDAGDRVKLAAYVWPEMKARVERLQAVFALAETRAPSVFRADAAAFVKAALAQEQQVGTTRVLMHSLVWQYLPDDTKAQIADAMEAAGQRATADRPMAWISLEGDRTLLKHRLRFRYWPDGGDWTELAHAHAHGGWIEWLAGEEGA